MSSEVPDICQHNSVEECHRQSRIVAGADAVDHDLDTFMDAALADLEVEEPQGL